MGPDRVVVPSPLLDDDLCFLQAVKDFTVQQFIASYPVEGLTVAVLPRATWLDEQGFGSNLRQPVAHDPAFRLAQSLRPSPYS